MAVVALLDGSVLAFKVNKLAAHRALTEQQAQQGAARGNSSTQLLVQQGLQSAAHDQQQVQQLGEGRELLSVHWQYKCAAPIFGSPVMDEGNGLMLVAAVDGTVCGVRLSTGQELWRVNVQGHVFADLLLLRDRRQQWELASAQAAAAAAAAAAAGRAAEAAADGDAGECCVVVATQGGWVVGLNSHSGQKVRQANRQSAGLRMTVGAYPLLCCS
jgi:outer membrane protein assembly factor BamB